MERVTHIPPSITSIGDLVAAMSEVGVLGCGRIGRAASIVRRMFDDPDCLTFLSLSGPMVPGGLRRIICHLVRERLVDVVVTSGANIVHDLIEAYGGAHYHVPPMTGDGALRTAGLGRIADIVVNNHDFEVLEENIYRFLDSLSSEQRTSMSPSEFLHALGTSLSDDSSILRQASLNDIPVFSPGLMDSMLGFHLYTFSTQQRFALDFVKDLRFLGTLVAEAKKTGAIILGGGLTKHFTMGSTILKGGLDLAVQMTLDRPEAGSLSGAPLQEGVSWQKVQSGADFETVIGDATALFPLIVLASMPR